MFAAALANGCGVFSRLCKMELDYAFLAERAGLLQDGKLVIFGADIDYVEVGGFPMPLQLALVLRLLLSPKEELEGHTFGLSATGANGERVDVRSGVPITTVRNEKEPECSSGARIILDVHMVVSDPGTNLFHLIVDDRELKTLRLRVDLAKNQSEETEHGAREIVGSK